MERRKDCRKRKISKRIRWDAASAIALNGSKK